MVGMIPSDSRPVSPPCQRAASVQGLHLAQNPRGMGENQAAKGRQHHIARAPLDKFFTKRRLHLADLHGKGGLGNADHLGGAAEIALF